MTVFKCKMCGGDLNIVDGATICKCDYCGTMQTLPKLDDEKRIALYERANYFRRNNEFDKAMGIYEIILSEENKDAEAYWSVVLCKYGVEYVEDPKTHKRIPTVNRASSKSILKDEDYLKAVQYADGYQKSIFEEEAKNIDNILKNILAISKEEKPYDVFICYKESDSSGQRTHDSVYAQEIYNTLQKEGFRTFFSRVTLEDKIGTAYEPYIYAALNSAKVMLIVGSSAENMNSPWVKNEWSRFLAIAKQDGKKAIIPCYKDMSPYDMPEEFAYLQAQDIGKIGFLQDLVHGIKKIISSNSAESAKEHIVVETQSPNAKPLLERTYIFLTDSEWEKANQYAERVLDIEPRNAKAYMCKFLASTEVVSFEQLKYDTINCHFVYDLNLDFFNALEFAEPEYAKELEAFVQDRTEAQYYNACEMLSNHNYTGAKKIFDELNTYKDSKAKSDECRKNMSTLKNKLNEINQGQRNIDNLNIQFNQYNEIKEDANKLIDECKQQLEHTDWLIKKAKNMITVSMILWLAGVLMFIFFAIGTKASGFLGMLFLVIYSVMYIVFNVFLIAYLKNVVDANKEKRQAMITCGFIFTPIANIIALISAAGLIDSSNKKINTINEILVKTNYTIINADNCQAKIKNSIARNQTIINDANKIVSQLTEKTGQTKSKQTVFEDKDPLFVEAGNVIMEAGFADTPLIQRKFGVGYSRGSKILDQLADAGVISKYNESKPREVLMSKELWDILKQEL